MEVGKREIIHFAKIYIYQRGVGPSRVQCFVIF